MSSITSNLSDAVWSDGTLKDTSEIIWSYNADESIPFPSGGNPHGSPPSGRHAQATTVTTHVVHQTFHISWSCWHIEEDKVESAPSAITPKTSGVKHEASSNAPGHCATCKIIIKMVSDNSSDDRALSLSPPPTKPADNDYEALWAMRDADNRVCSPQFLSSSHSHFNFRLWLSEPGSSIQLTFKLFSTVIKGISIQIWRRLWMESTGAWFVGKYLEVFCIYFISLMLTVSCWEDMAIKQSSCFFHWEHKYSMDAHCKVIYSFHSCLLLIWFS